jgi:hypothetical protein
VGDEGSGIEVYYSWDISPVARDSQVARNVSSVWRSKRIRRTFRIPEVGFWVKYSQIAFRITPAARALGNPKMPVDIAGIDIEDKESRVACSNDPLTAAASLVSSSPDPQIGPTAWIT